MPAERPAPRAVAAVAAATVAAAVLVVAWGGLVQAGGIGHRVALAALAALPALAVFAPRARVLLVILAVAASAVGALALALRRPAWDLVRLDADAWAAARGVLPDGVHQAADTPLPAALERASALVALLDLCLWALCAVAVWQLVVRRLPVGALVVVAVGLGYRWTVEPPHDGVRAGALALLAAIVILGLSGSRRPAAGGAHRILGTAVLGLGATAVALAVAAGPAPAGDGWWNWRDWRLDRPVATGAAGLDLRQRYGALDRDTPARPVLAVRTDRALPLRAAVLEDFDGDAFAVVRARRPDRTVPLDGGRVSLGVPAVDGASPVEQRIRVLGTHTNLLIAPARPLAAAGLPGAAVALYGDTVALDTTLREGDEYAVRSAVPTASAADLSAAPAYRAGEIPVGGTRLRPQLWGAPVDAPAWGTGGAEPSAAALGAYAPVRDLAREVAGDAPSAYVAVARIEAYLRRHHTYDEAPPGPRDAVTPAIVEFLFGARRGFCQHFAGAMGVMLRSIGIPARIAVGYTPGSYDLDDDVWIVDDRDAHSWVEVWFPGRGWLAFDPTPGRSAPTPASVSSSAYDPPSVGGGGPDLGLPSPDPRPTADPAPAGPDPAPPPAETPGVDASEADAPASGSGPWWVALAALSLAGACAVAAPAARRAWRRRRGDGRARIAGAIEDLERSFARAGAPVDPSAAPGERARMVRARTGVDASVFYRRTAEARFGAGEPAPAAVAWAWREGARLRRAVRRRLPWRRRLRRVLVPRATVKA